MESALPLVLESVLAYKYPALFVVTVLGGMGFPVPSNTILVACFSLALGGHFDVATVAAVGLVGHVLGDCIAFWLVRRYGLAVLGKLGLGWIPRSEKFRRTQRHVEAHPVATVFWTRFLGAITPVANVLAGLTNIPGRTFFLTDVVGQIGQIALLFAYGTVFGQNWTFITTVLGQFNAFIIVILCLVFLYYLLRRRTHGPRTPHAGAVHHIAEPREGGAAADVHEKTPR